MKKLLIATLVSAAFSTSVFAAQDGTLGATSTGNLNVTLEIENLVKVAGLDDIDLDTSASNAQNGFQNAIGHTNFCVYANNGSGTYDITATGSGAGGAFSLSSSGVPGAPEIAYEVNFAGSSIDNNTVGGDPLSAGAAFAATGGSISSGSLTCNSAADETSTIWVQVPGSELEGKPAAADYTGTLTIQVAAK